MLRKNTGIKTTPPPNTVNILTKIQTNTTTHDITYLYTAHILLNFLHKQDLHMKKLMKIVFYVSNSSSSSFLRHDMIFSQVFFDKIGLMIHKRVKIHFTSQESTTYT